MPPLLLLRVVLQPPVHLHRVMHLVEVLLLQVRAQVQLLHLRSLLQLQIQIQPPALHRAAPLVLATDAI
jgi:hypothetical protein